MFSKIVVSHTPDIPFLPSLWHLSLGGGLESRAIYLGVATTYQLLAALLLTECHKQRPAALHRESAFGLNDATPQQRTDCLLAVDCE